MSGEKFVSDAGLSDKSERCQKPPVNLNCKTPVPDLSGVKINSNSGDSDENSRPAASWCLTIPTALP